MSDLLTHFVETQMLIRKPIATVFDAFIDPSVTKNFWFTKGSDKLETGKTITWEWEMNNISTKVYVKEIQPNKKISIEWNEPAAVVDFEFTPLDNERTYVVIRNYGFHQTGDELLSIIRDSTGGFYNRTGWIKSILRTQH
jgi:uncharacterized protein YndB with AHSA1/START domain